MNDTDLKQGIKRIMLSHIGRANPIDYKTMRQDLGLSERESDKRHLRELTRELKRDLFPILFATKPPEGTENLKGYVIDECITIRALKTGGSRFLQGDKQLELI